MSSASEAFETGHGELLLGLARHSIAHGLRSGSPLTLTVSAYPETLQRKAACFVTLRQHQELRGCIGTLEPRRSLLEDVVENAFSAAFRDPRFPALGSSELAAVVIEISVLTPQQPVTFDSESQLLELLRPRTDGLVLAEGSCQATFLPSVWEQLPDPRQFLEQLKLKAGLASDYWSPSLSIQRYQTISLSE